MFGVARSRVGRFVIVPPIVAAVASLGVVLASGAGAAAPSAPGCSPSTHSFSGTPSPVADALAANPNIPQTTAFSVAVGGLSGSVYDVALRTGLTGVSNDDLSITLVPPASGAPPVLVRANRTDAMGNNTADPHEGSNVFNGTLWQDAGAIPARKYAFSDNVTASHSSLTRPSRGWTGSTPAS